MGYSNPLLSLPSAKLLLVRPLQKRLALSVLFRQVRAEANEKAVTAWARRQYHAGAFWRATSTYARHVAHLLCQDNPLGVKPSRLAQPRTLPITVEYRYPLLNLAGTKAICDFEMEERQILALLFDDLRTASRLEAENSWQKRKAPMASYWSDCARHARRISRLLARPYPLANALVVPSAGGNGLAVSDLAAWLTTATETSLDTEPCMQDA